MASKSRRTGSTTIAMATSIDREGSRGLSPTRAGTSRQCRDVALIALLASACGPHSPTPATITAAGVSPPARIAAGNAGAVYAGVNVCLPCHVGAATAWSGSSHAHSRDTLRAASAASNPDCLPCHVTGMGWPGGWAGASTPALEHVTCEACHGPGSEHVAAFEETPLVAGLYGQLPLAASACAGCHTPTNSPDFTFAKYWAKIQH